MNPQVLPILPLVSLAQAAFTVIEPVPAHARRMVDVAVVSCRRKR